MRLKRSELKVLYHCKRTVTKDAEGGTVETFEDAADFKGILWPAGGKVQAAMYGERLAYMYNIKVDGAYRILPDGNQMHYILQNGVDLSEKDGICLFAGASGEIRPDYQIVAIRPYEHLQLEVERIGRRPE